MKKINKNADRLGVAERDGKRDEELEEKRKREQEWEPTDVFWWGYRVAWLQPRETLRVPYPLRPDSSTPSRTNPPAFIHEKTLCTRHVNAAQQRRFSRARERTGARRLRRSGKVKSLVNNRKKGNYKKEYGIKKSKDNNGGYRRFCDLNSSADRPLNEPRSGRSASEDRIKFNGK